MYHGSPSGLTDHARNPICPCGKVCFYKRGAHTKANSLMRKGRERLRIYQCDESDFWHVSKERSRRGYHE
jgi:hypothetical protein